MVRPYDVSTTVELMKKMGKADAEGNVEFKIYTHCGGIHKDDVASCAAASLIVGDPSIVKNVRIDNNDIPSLGINDQNAMIVDVGKGRFDHHFDSRNPDEALKIRSYPLVMDSEGNVCEEIQMSAIARLWEYAGTNIVHECIIRTTWEDPNDEWCLKVAQKIEQIWVKPISDTDTRGQVARPNFMSANISRRSAMAMALGNNMDELFDQLVSETREELKAYIFTEYKTLKDAAAINDLATVASDKGHPCWINLTENWKDHIPANQFKGTVVRYVVESSNRVPGEWNLNAVDSVECPISDDVKSLEGFKFLHDKRFLAVFLSKESAEKAASICAKQDLDIW